MKFKALVRYANTLSTETLTLLPLHPLHVVIRMQASQTCYSSTDQLNTTNPAQFAAVAGHGGVGDRRRGWPVGQAREGRRSGDARDDAELRRVLELPLGAWRSVQHAAARDSQRHDVRTTRRST